MGSQKESSRPHKTAGLPSWAQESVSSTEQLMSSFYSTQEPIATSGNEAEKMPSLTSVHIDDSKPQEATTLRETSSPPLIVSLVEGQPEESDSSGELPQSLFTNKLHEQPSALEAASVAATVSEVSKRPEKAPRTHPSAPRRRQNLASSGQGWSNEVLVLSSFDSALVELLPGKSSILYKEFYLRTHGANPAVNEVRATKQLLSSWSGIANRNTLIKHIQHLIAVRLLKRTMAVGDTEGPMYTVRHLEDVGISKETAGAFYERVTERVRV